MCRFVQGQLLSINRLPFAVAVGKDIGKNSLLIFAWCHGRNNDSIHDARIAVNAYPQTFKMFCWPGLRGRVTAHVLELFGLCHKAEWQHMDEIISKNMLKSRRIVFHLKPTLFEFDQCLILIASTTEALNRNKSKTNCNKSGCRKHASHHSLNTSPKSTSHNEKLIELL